MTQPDYDNLFATITTLVLHHSPSGAETAINQFLLGRLSELGVEAWQDEADNVIAKIAGQDRQRSIAITAHK